MYQDESHLAIQELLIQYPFLKDFFTSLNIQITDPSRSLQQVLEAMDFNDFQNCGMGKEEILAYFHELLAKMSSLAQRQPCPIHSLTIYGGTDKSGNKENFLLTVRQGEVICIVGPTGSGKSRFLEDIEFLAQNDTPTHRTIYLNDAPPPADWRFTAERSLVAQLSQNMNFVMDLSVKDFIQMHAESRLVSNPAEMVADILACANRLSGESFEPSTSLTQLSGGQSRALMIADTALLSASPVVLIDEIENAGVDRQEALNLLIKKDKIIFVSTHDPLLALSGDKRLVIQNGGVANILSTSDKEKENLAILSKIDTKILGLRQLLRRGETIDFALNDYFKEV